VLFWWICVNDQSNVVNVNTASGNVGSDQSVGASRGESRQVTSASSLRQVAVQFNARNASFHELFCKASSAVLGACKDKCLSRRSTQALQYSEAVVVANVQHVVSHCINR
jgi:hypothetical protein